MIGSFASGTNFSLVAKNGTKKIILLLWIKSSNKPQIKKFHKIDLLKNGNSDSKYNFEIFKHQKSNQKDPPNLKKSKAYRKRPQIKKFL